MIAQLRAMAKTKREARLQSTSRSNVSKRVAKIAEHENLAAVRRAGIRVEVWGWSKLASGRWDCRVVDCS
jgi:carbonic anhydrase